MLQPVILLGLLALVKPNELLSLNYSFNVDFYNNSNSKICENKSAWRLVTYNDLDIDPLFMNSDKGIRAAESSCVKLPIILNPGILELNVYVRAISQDFKIKIEVFNENYVPIVLYAYGRTSEEFKPGWQTIFIDMDQHVKGYITIRGRSLNNEVVIIDSLRFKPSPRIIDNKKRLKRNNIDDEDENLSKKLSDFEIRNEEVIGKILNRELFESPAKLDDSFWSPLNISLVAVGAAVVIGITAVVAYQCGKIRARNKALPEFLNEAEPPRTITIPRVVNVQENGLSFY